MRNNFIRLNAFFQGKLVWNNGILVEALKNGYWIVLDELNLAPSEVLEALNRLLDDNRELFIPETQETITPHPDFALFATQNPPGVYGGRKVLSRAFRNRFLEIHFDDIPDADLRDILRKRCGISELHAKKLVNVMKELQRQRQSSRLFVGKHGFITLRDLFRWAERHPRNTQYVIYILSFPAPTNFFSESLPKRVTFYLLNACVRMKKRLSSRCA